MQQSFPASGTCSGVLMISANLKWDLMGFMTSISRSQSTVCSSCFELPTVSLYSITFYYKQSTGLMHTRAAQKHTNTHLQYMNSRLVHGNQRLLGPNRNVMVSLNLYWSTLSALIVWPGRNVDPYDAIGFERSPSKSCPPAILPPYFSSTSGYGMPQRFKDLICPALSASPCPQLISYGWK